MAERQLPKLNVAGSIPVSRSKDVFSLIQSHIVGAVLRTLQVCGVYA